VKLAVPRKPNTAAITLAIMYWEACRSIAQTQIAGRGFPPRVLPSLVTQMPHG